MPFKGFPAEAFDFFEGLEADNTKTYWQANKPLYERAVKAPMDALLADLASEFGPGRVFRPHRDVRFSNDKSPYKTNIGAVAERDGSVFYVSLSTGGLFAGSGYYRMARDQLQRFRAAVASDHGEQLEALVDQADTAGFEVGGEALKSAPRGYAGDHPRIRLLRHKGVTIGRSWEPTAWMGTAKCAGRVADVWRAAGPINGWLQAHVGPSTEPHSR
ncbi:MAG: DUF2461 domain-containing protein [Actinomycetota bacterium]